MMSGQTIQIHKRIYDLYDEYCHGYMDRREFLQRCGAISIAGVSGLAMAQAIMPRYAEAQTISFTDERIRPVYETYPSPGGNSGEMKGYLVTPAGPGPFPAVLVMHENRGLNPYIEDVARRFGTQGFLALAPDGLYPAGGYPGNDDYGRALQASLDQAALNIDMLNSAQFLRTHAMCNGKLGATGFCWGGGAVNYLAVTMADDLTAGVPFYGAAPASDQVASISAALLIQSAEDDERINALWPDFETALKAQDVDYTRHVYPGTMHGFHNNSTPRFDEKQAKTAEERMMAFFRKQLS